MTLYPEPDITLEMPTPLWGKIKLAWREIYETVAFIRAAYAKRVLLDAERKMFEQAFCDAHACGELVQPETYIWQAPVWGCDATGRRKIFREPRLYQASVHRRGPHFHSARQA